MFILKNGLYLSPEGKFIEGDICIENDTIKCITNKGESICCHQKEDGEVQIIDLEGKR